MTTPPPPPPPPPPEEPGSTVVPAGGLTIWTAPDPSLTPSGALPAGTPIRVAEHAGAWARVVDPSGASWWVDGRLLTGGAPAAPRSAASGKWLIGAIVVAVVAVGAFLLTRDGDGGTVAIDDLSAEEQAVAGSLSEAIATSEELGELGGLGTGAGPVLDPEAIDCVSAGVVSDVGLDRLEELGVTAEGATGGGEALTQLTVEEREQVADRILGCVDLEQVISDGLEAQGLDPAIGSCLLDKIGQETIRDILVVGLSGEEMDLEADPEMGEALMVAFFTCIPGDVDLGDLDLGG